MYYPTRGLRTRRYKYLKNLYPELSFPHASDLGASKTWQSILKGKSTHLGARRVQDYLQRPAEELYDLENDPEEVKNLAGDPRHAELIKKFRGRFLDFQKRTDDPWARSAAEWGEFLFGSGSDPNRVPGNLFFIFES